MVVNLYLNFFTQSCMDIEKKLSSFEKALDSMFKNLEDGKIVFSEERIRFSRIFRIRPRLFKGWITTYPLDKSLSSG